MEYIKEVEYIGLSCVILDLLSGFGLLESDKHDDGLIVIALVNLCDIILGAEEIKVLLFFEISLFHGVEESIVVSSLYEPIFEYLLFFFEFEI